MARKKAAADTARKVARAKAGEEAVPVTPLYPRASLQTLVLRQLAFQQFNPWPEPMAGGFDAQVQFLLSAFRIGPGQLQVEFETKVAKEGLFDMSVAYRMTFVLEDDVGDEVVLFRRVAAHLAPVVAFPYIRETVTSIAAKSGARMPVVLPIMNVGAMFKPDAIEIEESPAAAK